MSNWCGMLDAIRASSKLPSFLPADLSIPMVAPQDLGEAAASRLLEPADDIGLKHIEGPERYTPRDVATAFSEALDMTIEVEVIPREKWVETFEQFGFSKPAAQSYACMTGTVVDETVIEPDNVERGRTTLRDHVDAWVQSTR